MEWFSPSRSHHSRRGGFFPPTRDRHPVVSLECVFTFLKLNVHSLSLFTGADKRMLTFGMYYTLIWGLTNGRGMALHSNITVGKILLFCCQINMTGQKLHPTLTHFAEKRQLSSHFQKTICLNYLCRSGNA